MSDLLFVLTPLLVLPIVVLFRFVGCSSFEAAPGPPPPPPETPRYRDYLMGDPKDASIQKNPLIRPNKNSIIGYWRLVDSGSTAADEKLFRNGEFKSGQSLDNQNPTPSQAGSEPAPGTFLPGQNSLVPSDKTATCRFFNGGYVVMPFKDGLYTDDFTIEAWIDAQWSQGKTGYQHTLFSAAGHFTAQFDSQPKFHGFALFADRDNRWQAVLLPHSGHVFTGVLPLVPRNRPTHVALTVTKAEAVGAKKLVSLYVDGKVAAIATTAFYSLPDGAALFIGIGNASPGNPSTPSLTSPIISKVQEVVLHSTALSQDEIENHATFKV